MASLSSSSESCTQWMQKVHSVQSKRTPEAWEAAKCRIEQSRQHEASYRKCKAVKSHAVRSRALAAEGLRQMALSDRPDEHLAVQARWKSAQEASKSRQLAVMKSADDALISRAGGCSNSSFAAKMNDAAEEEEDAMMEVAQIVGATDVVAMAAVGHEGLDQEAQADGARSSATPKGKAARRRSERAGQSMPSLLEQLRNEPKDEAECTAKFLLYEGYATEVEEMRGTLFKFYEESRPTVPPAIAGDMDKQIKGIDTTEAMGIPDRAREWFVFHMMRQAERNNLKMAGILDGFEKKLEFLASNDQKECPICLEDFASEGPHIAETLGCCHKVCRDCWDSWSTVTHGRPFCPLCRHDAFLQRVAEEARGMQ